MRANDSVCRVQSRILSLVKVKQTQSGSSNCEEKVHSAMNAETRYLADTGSEFLSCRNDGISPHAHPDVNAGENRRRSTTKVADVIIRLALTTHHVQT
jgi:hypothetical protein